jgi:hypothetical protein
VTDEDLTTEVAARMATVLLGQAGAPATDRMTEAAAAAVALVRGFIYGDIVVVPPLDLPSSEDAIVGLTALGVRVYHDPASPGGVVGGDAYTGAAIPEDLLAHVRHYWSPYKRAFGIAL